jgi:hypothetical protein
MAKLSNNDLTLKVGFDIDKFTSELQKTTTSLNSFAASATKTLNGFGATIIATFSVQAIMGFTKEMVKVTAEFQKFEAILTNTLGSNVAAKSGLYQITQLAAKTPFQIDEITAAFIRWQNIGLSPTMKNMNQIGDVASSLGAGFEQTAEAFKDLMVGQTKRIEEVGISATQKNGIIQLSFKGVNLEIAKTAEGVQKALETFSALQGVQGTSAVIAETLGGKISNLEDKWTIFLKTLGEGNNGALGGAVSLLDQALAIATDLVKTTEQRKGENVMSQSSAVLDKYKTLDEAGQVELVDKIYKKLIQTQIDMQKAKENAHTASIPIYNQNKLDREIALQSIELIRSYNAELKKKSNVIDEVTTKTTKLANLSLKNEGQQFKNLNLWQSQTGLPSNTGKVAKPELSNVGQWIAGLQATTKALNDKADAENAAAAAALNHTDNIDKQILQAAQLGEVMGENFGLMVSGAMDFASGMRKMANDVVEQLYRIAQMQMIAKFAGKPGGMLLASAGLAALKGLVSGLLNKGGGGGSTTSMRGNVGGFGEMGQRIELYSTVRVTGQDLEIAMSNRNRFNGRTKG